MADFQIDVPINVKGSVETKSKSDLVKKDAGLGSDKSEDVLMGILGKVGVVALLWQGLEPLLKPILNLLKAVMVMFFVPLFPIVNSIIKFFSKGMVASSEAPQLNIQETDSQLATIVKSIINSLLRIGAFFVGLGKEIGTWLLEGVIQPISNWILNIIDKSSEFILKAINKISQFIIDTTIKGFQFFLGIGQFIWETILEPAWMFLRNVGQLIWTEILQPAWNWFKDIGNRIWSILKGAFSSAVSIIKSGVKSLFSFSKDKSERASDFIIRPDGSMLKTASDDFLIGTKNPSGLFGGGQQITININHPSVREERDIKQLAEQVSIALQKQMRLRY